MIVDNLRVYKQPVFMYLPPGAELRGGAWVVVDTTINPDMIEMYADNDARGGVLEPEVLYFSNWAVVAHFPRELLRLSSGARHSRLACSGWMRNTVVWLRYPPSPSFPCSVMSFTLIFQSIHYYIMNVQCI
jgi:hypothetical protein